ncbi:MAG: hypothetical protein ACPG5W_00970 [Flavobacteriales bacterium]
MQDALHIKSNSGIRGRVFIAACLVIFLHVLGVIFPEKMWGVHFLSFLSGWLMLGFLAISVLGLVLIWSADWDGDVFNSSTEKDLVWSRMRWIFPLLAGAFTNLTPIIRDVYGDSYFIAQELEVMVQEWTPEMTASALAYNPLDPKEGVATFYTIANFLGFIFQVESATVVRYFQVLLVMVFNGLWLSLITKCCSKLSSRLALGVIGLLVPIGLVFHQHYETYALPLTMFMGFVLLLKHFYQKQTIGVLLALLGYLLVGLKFHISFWLLFPAIILAALNFMSQKVAVVTKLLKPRNTFLFMVLPGLVLIATVYALHGSINGTRLAPPDNLYDALFVPIFPLEGAPYNRYSLFGLPHVLDYLQILFTWGPACWFVLIVGLFSGFWRKNAAAYSLNLMVCFVAMIAWFFILNPLLGMSADWDLFAFPAVILMGLTAQVFGALENKPWVKKLAATAICLALLNVPVYLVNANSTMLASRYEALFKNDFKHFWIGSSTFFEAATELELNPQLKLQNQVGITAELEQYAIENNDVEYAEILRQTAITYGNLGNLSSALEFHQKAALYGPNLKKNVVDLVVVNFKLNQPQNALQYLDKLVAGGYPSKRKAVLMAVHVSVAARDYERAKFYCGSYLQHIQEDAFLLKVYNTLNSEQPSEAAKLFAGS